MSSSSSSEEEKPKTKMGSFGDFDERDAFGPISPNERESKPHNSKWLVVACVECKGLAARWRYENR